ncbi:MalY/PatB family protein [Ornithinimicrobium cavernae]|uniref:MalY/PatB family protein n=1 Tax=Ornithinimicrobium cavernae TaxID=2666047 RepID=UPI000D68D577|nr:aminotransferase class I/II-fold pyridoxal phosphate-dependent enzyme [Ornithinimicrobium cavernae]
MTVANPLEQLTEADLREQRTSVKWRAFPPDVLPLWVAEQDSVLAEPVVRAVVDAMHRGDTGYVASGQDYAEALASFAVDRWGWTPDTEHTAIVPDVMIGVTELLRLVTGPGDNVVVNCPVYPPFYAFVRSMDRRIVESPLTPELRLDLDDLARAFGEATAGGRRAAYLLCSPHNPTGTLHTASELEAVAALAEEHGVRVVADEIHAPLVYSGHTFVPYLSVPGGERGMSMMSASKGWNLAGLKSALALAGPEAWGDLARLPEEVGHGASHLAVQAHVAAYRDGGIWLDALLEGLDGNRHLLADLLAEHLPRVGYRVPDATYLAWLDCRGLGIEDPPLEPGLVSLSVGPAAMFAATAKVGLSAGTAFGTGGSGHVRLNLATSQAILTEAVERMGRAAADH